MEWQQGTCHPHKHNEYGRRRGNCELECAVFASTGAKLARVGDRRRHRGPHPLDHQLFSEAAVPVLARAVRDLSWLKTRGYSDASAMKLVGDRYQLRQRQRVAVGRCACSDSAKQARASRERAVEGIAGQPILIDGLNVITTIEVALSGGALFIGRDRCLRDMASFHGSYRLVEETERAVAILVDLVDAMSPSSAKLYIDRPVSNSGRLAEVVRRLASKRGSMLQAETADRVDEALQASSAVVATADSRILDACSAWVSLARAAVEANRAELEPLWLLDFSD